MAEKAQEPVRGFCPHCKEFHDVVPVSDEEAKVIAEDAQDPADYYKLTEHNNSTGAHCEKGSGETPQSLAGSDDYGESDYGEYDDDPPCVDEDSPPYEDEQDM